MKWVESFRTFAKIHENKDYEYFLILKWTVTNNTLFIHKTSGVSLTALIDTFGRFSWYDMIWHLLQLTWEIRLCDQKGILLCCRGTGEHSVIRPLWWTNSEIGLKNKFQHIQTPSKHSMNIFFTIFPSLLYSTENYLDVLDVLCIQFVISNTYFVII